MYKSAVVHLKNKYPGSIVLADDHSIDVHDADGTHRVAIKKNGAGMWVDQSAEMGCSDRFCLAPIPKQARVHKLFADGRIGRSEEADDREASAAKIQVAGRVPSIAEFVKAGSIVDAAGNLGGLAAAAQPKSLGDAQKAISAATADQF